MDWSNERYVRLYTRTTADLLAFGWEGRLVWYELMRAADRSGVLEHGGDLAVMPELLRVPAEVWSAGWPRIAQRGSAVDTGSAIVIPNMMPANEAPQSDRLRSQLSREARRAKHMTTAGVTNRDAGITERDEAVTKRDQTSRAVTPRHSDLIRADLIRADPEQSDARQERAQPPKGRAARRAPDTFAPSERHVGLAAELGVNLDFELAKFRDHEFAKPRTDWPAAFRNWLRGAKPSQRPTSPRTATPQSDPETGTFDPKDLVA